MKTSDDAKCIREKVIGKAFRVKYGKDYLQGHSYRAVAKKVNDAVVEYLLEGFIYYAPMGLGKIMVGKHQPRSRFTTVNGLTLPKNRQVDFNKTNKLRKSLQPTWTNEDWKKIDIKDRPKVMYDNNHTDGYIYRILWKRSITTKNIRLWMFKPARSFKRALAQVLKSPTKPTYYEKNKY